MLQDLTDDVALEHGGAAYYSAHHRPHDAGGYDVGASQVKPLDRSLRPEPPLLEAAGIVRQTVNRALGMGGEVPC